MIGPSHVSLKLRRAVPPGGVLIFLVAYQALQPSRAELHQAPEASSLSGPARAVDGDTIEIGAERIRLEGIDAPELAQSCARADRTPWPCGKAARQALVALIAGRDVTCQSKGRDKYGRLLAICFAGGDDLNAAMVRTGNAWAFVKYSSSYTAEEQDARRRRAGVWQGESEAPWDFRHSGWRLAETRAPSGCAIKGNVSHNGRIYHMPWSPWYDRVTIDESRGEQWFCSEADAQAAGWRPARAY